MKDTQHDGALKPRTWGPPPRKKIEVPKNNPEISHVAPIEGAKKRKNARRKGPMEGGSLGNYVREHLGDIDEGYSTCWCMEAPHMGTNPTQKIEVPKNTPKIPYSAPSKSTKKAEKRKKEGANGAGIPCQLH